MSADAGLGAIPHGWFVYRGTGRPLRDVSLRKVLPAPPPWRTFDGAPLIPTPQEDLAELDRRLGPVDFLPPRTPDPDEVIAVNAASTCAGRCS